MQQGAVTTTIDQAAKEIPSGMDRVEGGVLHGWNAETPGSANQQAAASSFKMPLLSSPHPPFPLLYTRIAETFLYTRLCNPESAAAAERFQTPLKRTHTPHSSAQSCPSLNQILIPIFEGRLLKPQNVLWKIFF